MRATRHETQVVATRSSGGRTFRHFRCTCGAVGSGRRSYERAYRDAQEHERANEGVTEADFWLAHGGQWRTARMAHWRTHQRRSPHYQGVHCPAGDDAPAIQPGDRHIDTGESDEPGYYPRTIRVCAACAERPTIAQLRDENKRLRDLCGNPCAELSPFDTATLRSQNDAMRKQLAEPAL